MWCKLWVWVSELMGMVEIVDECEGTGAVGDQMGTTDLVLNSMMIHDLGKMRTRYLRPVIVIVQVKIMVRFIQVHEHLRVQQISSRYPQSTQHQGCLEPQRHVGLGAVQQGQVRAVHRLGQEVGVENGPEDGVEVSTRVAYYEPQWPMVRCCCIFKPLDKLY